MFKKWPELLTRKIFGDFSIKCHQQKIQCKNINAIMAIMQIMQLIRKIKSHFFLGINRWHDMSTVGQIALNTKKMMFFKSLNVSQKFARKAFKLVDIWYDWKESMLKRLVFDICRSLKFVIQRVLSYCVMDPLFTYVTWEACALG